MPNAARQAVVSTLGLLLVLALAGCGEDEPATANDDSSATSAPSATPSESASAVPESGSTEAPSAPATPDDADLPGEPLDGVPPLAGDVLGVVGVAADDVLNVRAVPDPGAEVVGELSPLADDVKATGRNRSVDSDIWAEVEAGGERGWVNAAYLGYLGATEDLTSKAGNVAAAADLQGLAAAVARSLLGKAEAKDGVVVDGPTDGGLSEITLDYLGAADDSVAGTRLHVFAEGSPGSYTLRTVGATTICSRGVAEGGLCL